MMLTALYSDNDLVIGVIAVLVIFIISALWGIFMAIVSDKLRPGTKVVVNEKA